MAATVQQREALDSLIAELERAQGPSRVLDLRIDYALAARDDERVDIARLMVEEGIGWDTVLQALDERVPAYTGSLDAAVAGETIIFTIRSRKRGAWGAVHRARGGREILAWGATEALARRLAGLLGLRETVAAAAPPEEQPAAEGVGGAETPRRPGSIERAMAMQAGGEPSGEGDWKVLF